MDVLWGTFHHMVSDAEVLLASPHLMDIRAHEASRVGHLLESVGEVVGPFMVTVGAVHVEIHPHSSLNEISLSQRLPGGSPSEAPP